MKIQSIYSRLPAALWAALLLGLLSSSITLAQETATAPSQDAAEAVVDAETEEEAETPPPTGLHRPMNGKNLKTFEKDLARVKSEVTEVEFTTLMNAIGYLRVYDLAAAGDKEKVYQHLDGKTATEIMKMVKWRTGQN